MVKGYVSVRMHTELVDQCMSAKCQGLFLIYHKRGCEFWNNRKSLCLAPFSPTPSYCADA